MPAPEDRLIDLHAHTTASDGDFSPSQLVEVASLLKLQALAVTDHDTTGGLAEAMEAGERYGVEVVPGIELSAEPPSVKGAGGKRPQCHILGLFIDPASVALQARLLEVVHNRNHRNAKIVEKMQADGMELRLEEVEALAGGEIIARPHFAQLMIQKGKVVSMQEAFDVYLGKGGKYYVERDRLMPVEAINLIHRAGGVAILAHPTLTCLIGDDLKNYLSQLQDAGLDGIEARYNLNTPEQTSSFLALAEKMGFVTSGGSDFHGRKVKPRVFLGDVEGGLPAPYGLLSRLEAKCPPVGAMT